jgi:hypothetical protein
MKSVTSESDRRLLLEKLRIAVRVQIGYWNACGDVRDILGNDGDDAVFLVEGVAPKFAGKEVQLSDLDAIQGGFWKINPSIAKKLSHEMQRTLLVFFQNAVRLQEESLRWADSLAKVLGSTREEVLADICNFAIGVDTGEELNERDLQMLLRELESKDSIGVEGPLES